jgi:hypothetical protein
MWVVLFESDPVFATFGLSKVADVIFDWGTRADIACEIAVDN